jgi:hypothetical protein
MPVKKRPNQRSLSSFKESPNKEGKKSVEEQEYNDENVRQRRRKISRQFPFRNGLDVG